MGFTCFSRYATFIQDKEVNQSDLAEISVTAFWGRTQDVIEYQPSAQSPMPKASAKTIDFPTPSDCGHRDTGINGIVATTQKAYIHQLQQSLNVRVTEIESNYRKISSGFKSWAVNESIAVVAACFAFPEVSFIAFLSYAGVALSTIGGVKVLGEAISLPKYADYKSTNGKYGDIYDPTAYNAYVRVYDNTGESRYYAGLLGDGTFNYTKKGYTGIKTNTQVIEKTAYNFNSCIASYGSNIMYYPPGL